MGQVSHNDRGVIPIAMGLSLLLCVSSMACVDEGKQSLRMDMEVMGDVAGIDRGDVAGIDRGDVAGIDMGDVAGIDMGEDMVTGGIDLDMEPFEIADPWIEEGLQLARDGQLSLMPQAQRIGDPQAGWDYLRYGNYIGTGIPFEAFSLLNVSFSDGNVLMREGDNEELSRSFNAFDAPNGVRVIGGITCMGCHSSHLDGQMILGLGNAFSSFVSDRNSALVPVLTNIINTRFGEDSPEAEAYLEFSRGSTRVSPYALAPFRGVNPAFRLEDAAASMRNPSTFEWLDEPLFEVSIGGFASDVPPWWNVKKKAALYYNGMGRGDFPKMMMQTSVVAISNTEQAKQIHSHFDDLLAWIYQLEPPLYPHPLDENLRLRGEMIFNEHCSSCHGTYHIDPAQETYPNLLIALDVVGTDPHYARHANETPALSRWLNQGWYADTDAEGGDSFNAFPLLGYVAPPLDGIWATAPYLHNGSVPTLAALLNSDLRPIRWQRNFESSAYDYERIGWPYIIPADHELQGDPTVYDTDLEGYSGQGHIFGDVLNESERAELMEYLCSL